MRLMSPERSASRGFTTTAAMVLAAVVATQAVVGSAGAAEDRAAAAEALFRSGLRDMLAGRFEHGCADLKESFHLDPRPGALFTLAECEARAGRSASAVKHYEEFLALVERLPRAQRDRHRDRVRVAQTEKLALESRISRLKLVASQTPAGIVVRHDGRTLDGSALGVPLPVDPGEHVIALQLPDGTQREQRIVLAEGESREVLLSEMLAAPPPTPPTPPAPASARETLASTQSRPADRAEPRISATNTASPDLSVGTSLAREVPKPADSAGGRGLGLTLVGAGGLTTLLGAGALTVAWLKVRALEDDVKADRPFDPKNDNWSSYEVAGYVLLGTGAVLAITGGALLLWRRSSNVALVPQVAVNRGPVENFTLLGFAGSY